MERRREVGTGRQINDEGGGENLRETQRNQRLKERDGERESHREKLLRGGGRWREVGGGTKVHSIPG